MTAILTPEQVAAFTLDANEVGSLSRLLVRQLAASHEALRAYVDEISGALRAELDTLEKTHLLYVEANATEFAKLRAERDALLVERSEWAFTYGYQEELESLRAERDALSAEGERVRAERDALACRECCTNCGRWNDEPACEDGSCAEFAGRHPCDMQRRDFLYTNAAVARIERDAADTKESQ